MSTSGSSPGAGGEALPALDLTESQKAAVARLARDENVIPPPIALARELTKLHEQVLRGSASEVRAALREDQKRGEIVLVLGGRTRVKRGEQA